MLFKKTIFLTLLFIAPQAQAGILDNIKHYKNQIKEYVDNNKELSTLCSLIIYAVLFQKIDNDMQQLMNQNEAIYNASIR